MRGDLGSDIDSTRLRPAHDFNGTCRGDVAYVETGTNMLGKQDIAGNDAFLGDSRPAGESQHRGNSTFVHLCASG